jgi:hypothetical protein
VPGSFHRLPAACLVLLPGLWLGACEQSTTPQITPGTPLDLGAETWLSDGLDAVDEVVDVPDATDVQQDSDALVGIGEACNLLEGGCALGLKCTPDLVGVGRCQRLAAPPHAQGETCGQAGADDCDRGLLCYAPPDGGETRCYLLCDASSGAGCSATQQCSAVIPWVSEPMGVCLEP